MNYLNKMRMNTKTKRYTRIQKSILINTETKINRLFPNVK